MPAAFCRKAVVSTKEFEVWGDGKQTRSFMYIDDCVEGSIRMLLSDCAVPLNLGAWCPCFASSVHGFILKGVVTPT